MYPYLDPPQVAEILGVSKRLVQQLMNAGEIQAFKVRRKQWRTTVDMVNLYVSRQMLKSPRPVTESPTQAG